MIAFGSSKGSDLDAVSCGGKGVVLIEGDDDDGDMSGVKGKDEARGDGCGGANGPETDRVRLWLCPNVV